jgi:DNA-binding NtrC family response regulator
MSIGFDQIRARIRELPLRRAASLALENRQLRHALGAPWAGRMFVGGSDVTLTIVRTIRIVAALDGPVLVTGERGVGKRLVARLIHNESPRRDRPYIPVNCLALPGELAEAELFGFERDALPSASGHRAGRLELAQDGTVVLDEIAGLTDQAQHQLVRLLKYGSIRRVGARRSVPVSTRLIACSSRDLPLEASRRRFDPELCSRLGVLNIAIPPLRARRDDIPSLAVYVMSAMLGTARAPLALDDDAMELLVAYDWPGNVRELEHVLERAAAVSDGIAIRPKDLPREIRAGAIARVAPGLVPIRASLREVERLALVQTLSACGGNGAEAARRLGISKKGIYIKMRRFGLSKL